MTDPVWFSSLQVIIWIRLAVTVLGCLIGFLIWVDALVDYRLRKRLNLNGGLLILAVWQVLTESGHLLLSLAALYLSYEAWRVGPVEVAPHISMVFTLIVLIIVLLSINSFVKRRRFVSHLQSQGLLP